MGALEGQTAIITGAGSGIGRATTLRFVAEGASVVMVDVNEKGMDVTRGGCSVPGRACAVAGDVRDEDVADSAVEAAVRNFRRLDIVVNNAARCTPMSFPERPYDKWVENFDIILKGAFQFSRTAARWMMEHQVSGRIVNVTSIHGEAVERHCSNYDAAKAALNHFTRCLAVELAFYNIRANAVAPGFVATPMTLESGELESEDFQREYVRKGRIPMARAGRPEEIAAAILFLASEESSYVNGHVLTVDGGLVCTF